MLKGIKCLNFKTIVDRTYCILKVYTQLLHLRDFSCTTESTEPVNRQGAERYLMGSSNTPMGVTKHKIKTRGPFKNYLKFSQNYITSVKLLFTFSAAFFDYI